MKKIIIVLFLLPLLIYGNNYKGIDVSRYQGKILWHKIDTTIKFVIIKATEGINHKDNMFDYNWNNVPKNKIYRGAYHFFRPNKSGIEQAKFFINTVKFQKGDIIPVIDIEKMCYKVTYVYKKRHKKIIKTKCVEVQNITAYHNLRDMVDYIFKVLHVKPILYTTTTHWKSYYEKNFENEHHHILWIADYRKTVTEPKIPLSWSEWTIWQYSPKCKVCGISKYVDINVSKKHPSNFLIK